MPSNTNIWDYSRCEGDYGYQQYAYCGGYAGKQTTSWTYQKQQCIEKCVETDPDKNNGVDG